MEYQKVQLTYQQQYVSPALSDVMATQVGKSFFCPVVSRFRLCTKFFEAAAALERRGSAVGHDGKMVRIPDAAGERVAESLRTAPTKWPTDGYSSGCPSSWTSRVERIASTNLQKAMQRWPR